MATKLMLQTNAPRRNFGHIMVVSPHQDDAALSIGGTMYRWTTLGSPVRIVNCFTISNYAPFSVKRTENPKLVRLIRNAEDAAFCSRVGGNIKTRSLDELDAILRLGTSDLNCILTHRPLDDADLWAVGSLQKKLRNSWSNCMAVIPLAIGSHIDHRVAHLASVFSLQSSNVAFYEDLPYAARVSPSERKKAIVFTEQLTGLKLSPIRIAIDTNLKRTLLEAYSSQLSREDIENTITYSRRGEAFWIPKLRGYPSLI